MEHTEYKIRRKIDGKFSTGGRSPGFSKGGKTWTSHANLRRHLAELEQGWGGKDRYEDCELVEYTYALVAEEVLPLADARAEVDARRNKRIADRKRALESHTKTREMSLLQALREKYPDA